jgi:acyl carrier protein
MNAPDIEQRVLELLLEIAPDVDPSALRRDAPFRDQFDFDSMDTLNFAISLHRAFGVDVPETGYRHLASVASTTAYIAAELERRGAAPG